MRWAAIVIPGTILGFIWLGQPNPSGSQVATVPASIAPAVVATPNTLQLPQPTVEKEATPNKKERLHRKELTPENLQQRTQPQEKTASLPESVTPLEDVTIEPAPEATPLAAIHETKPIVLVYTLEPIASRVVPQAEEKKTPLGRVVQFANTVKHSDPIADLRGMKDELLAIDLRKKSTKRN